MTVVFIHIGFLFLFIFFAEMFKRLGLFGWIILAFVFFYFFSFGFVSSHYSSFFLYKFPIVFLSLLFILLIEKTMMGKIFPVSFFFKMFFAVNVLAAVFYDITNGVVLNSLTGFLVVGVMLLQDNPELKKEGVFWDLPYVLIVIYLLWNFLFTTFNWPGSEGVFFVLLFSSFVYCVFDRKRWVQARVFTLFTFMMVIYFWPAMFMSLIGNSWFDSRGLRWVEIFTFMMTSFYFAFLLFVLCLNKIKFKLTVKVS